MILAKYSIGIGDRFGRQGQAQLAALEAARKEGVEITPVWNKSNREHSIIGTRPADTRKAADAAVKAAGWQGPYRVDADHIGLGTVDAFIECSDFFTLDVADKIGREAPEESVRGFLASRGGLAGKRRMPGVREPMEITRPELERAARKFLLAAQEAGRIYRRIQAGKGRGAFVTEVSMDETDSPQTPAEMLVILAALADENVPAQTIAPRFSGTFHKGVDYRGDPEAFAAEFERDVAVLAFAAAEFGLPGDLKLSLHSGSDKFSLYGPVRRILRRHDAGFHIKTAGTTWLEEVIGLAEAGGEGLALAKRIYAAALDRLDELCAPYAAVIGIRASNLPPAGAVARWTAGQFVAALRHDATSAAYNPDFRQLLHVAYRVAAEMGGTYMAALAANRDAVARNVTANLLDRHVRPLFLA
jgi:hypothetical protein